MKKDRLNDFIGLRCTSDDRDRLQSHADGMCESLSSAILSLALRQLEEWNKPRQEIDLNIRIKREIEGITSVPDHKFQEIIRNLNNFDKMYDVLKKTDPYSLSWYIEVGLRVLGEVMRDIPSSGYVADKLAEARRSGKLDEKQAQNECNFTFGALDQLEDEVKEETIQEVEEVISEDIPETDTIRFSR
ncbi:MAG: hypothetical protein H8D35_03385 [Nitrosopumilus sp.]|nr:hypothetical protein [Nitrosopumilus sp.]MBL7015012.1 hypothetical protein [Nitrosopumilus sp.]